MSSSSSYPHPSSSRSITIDPSAPGTIIRHALAIESLLNILFAAYIFYTPASFLSFLASSTNPLTSPITPLTETFALLFGIMILTITIPMLLAIPNTRRGFELRVPVYTYLGSSEVMLVALFTYLYVVVGENGSGMSDKSLLFAASNLALPMGFRAYVLWVKPQWIGRYHDASGEKKE